MNRRNIYSERTARRDEEETADERSARLLHRKSMYRQRTARIDDGEAVTESSQVAYCHSY